MECNKDEAIRAMEIAEKNMKNNDFEGARKFALRAQNLYPELENISQLLCICDVHCSAQKPMLGFEKDWYGILQVEKFADELAVKKQYRRLALFLHPDKNRFPGAEAAFKLICEANAVLSDPTKKSLYDNKIRATIRSAPVFSPPHHMNKNSQFNQQRGAHVKVSNVFNPMDQHQAKQTSFSSRQDTFWTSCPFCSFKYQFDRIFVRTNLRCLKCSKNFTGYEIGAQGVPLASKQAPESAQGVSVKPSASQSYGFQDKGAQNQGTFKVDFRNGKGFSASRVGFQFDSRQTVQLNVQTEKIFKGKKVGKPEKVSGGGKQDRTCNGDANNRKTGDLKNKRKRGRKFAVESSESYDDTSSDTDLEEVTIEKNFDAATNLNYGPSQVHAPRRSSRNRQNISYHEEEDDDLLSSLKRSRGSKLSEDSREGENDTLDGESRKHGNEYGLPTDADYSKSESKETLEKAGGMSDISADAIENETGSDKDTCQCDDPEFYDFEKDRDVSCFGVNQFWACYDSIDGMPRFYAKVKKVSSSPFGLSITWLEADPANDEQKKWIDEELPSGCGSFKLGSTEITSRRLMFAQQVHCGKGKKRGSLIIHPRVGEVWALFKDWDSSWSSEPENHKVHKYEVVEVLSDFDVVAGSRVCYLDKVEGFVSLFWRTSQSGIHSFMIRPNEVYRFSHRIPCYKMNGSERKGVPVGSFELDPASLPPNPDDLYYPGKEKVGTDNTDPGVHQV